MTSINSGDAGKHDREGNGFFPKERKNLNTLTADSIPWQRCNICFNPFQAQFEVCENQQADSPERDSKYEKYDNGKTSCESFADSEKRESDNSEELIGTHVGWSARDYCADMNDQKYGGPVPKRKLQPARQHDKPIGKNLSKLE
jgi:hypothetical protein